MAKAASPVFIPGISYLCEDQRPWGTSNESDIVGVTTDMSKGRFNNGQQHLIPAAVGLASQLPGSWHTGTDAGVHCPPVQAPLQLKRSDLQSSSSLSQQAGLPEGWGRGMNGTSAVACESKFQEGRNMLGSLFSLG